MNWGQLLFSFDGRVGRSVYWGFTVAVIVLFCLLAGVMVMTTDVNNPQAGGGLASILMGIAGLLVIWPSLAVQAKRWHDVDKSAWWILIAFVPFVGGLIALVFNGFIPGTPGPNRYGNPS
ncbi:MAG: hypothetical protein BGP24_16995 [Lysobacterales bacterium 69-70]|nr:DUF805 domain-containing protein [Xanthomonadaceae bacterium]ODU30673.1 MAG: hypothetical protein ABS97_20335 [Xanthomonadaceae bacterium SCN 69-320]ODV16081.1 MAG: hypothetical protein ABT27_20910 [Xanthomonadaceae bacterium SCN 69-25]OJZ00212.1 MAG: hypothetical protein BGP24_16995 [Xanthomonadales bacterium 69-70]